MKKMNRMEFLKEVGRLGVLAGVVGVGALFVSRKDKRACSEQCGICAEYRNGICGVGLK